jgi:hypothetical protein
MEEYEGPRTAPSMMDDRIMHAIAYAAVAAAAFLLGRLSIDNRKPTEPSAESIIERSKMQREDEVRKHFHRYDPKKIKAELQKAEDALTAIENGEAGEGVRGGVSSVVHLEREIAELKEILRLLENQPK